MNSSKKIDNNILFKIILDPLTHLLHKDLTMTSWESCSVTRVIWIKGEKISTNHEKPFSTLSLEILKWHLDQVATAFELVKDKFEEERPKDEQLDIWTATIIKGWGTYVEE